MEPDHSYPRDAVARPCILSGASLPADPQRHRVRVFIDFWNYTLTMRDHVDPTFETDWAKLGPELARAAVAKVDAAATGEYQGMNFYGSYDRITETKLHRCATTVVDTFPGVTVSMVARQKKRSPPKCPTCRSPVATCPSCGADMRGTEEKGVDVRMATDMISLAWIDNYDVAVLVSADRDFVPLAEFLQTRGLKVIHGAFPPAGAQLTQRCWGSVDIPNIRANFQR